MSYWLVKSDPDSYSWEHFSQDATTIWEGVRNYQARNNLDLMKLGEYVLFYHSQTDKSIVGLAKIIRESFQDPSTADGRWRAVELELVRKFNNFINLEQMKADIILSNIGLIKQSRLSVSAVTKEEFDEILKMSKKG